MAQIQIMIVEDERLVAKDLQLTLQDCGYAVAAVAATGAEAVRQATAVPLDLVLMDIELEGEMDGVETATRLREQFHLPVIYLTAYLNDEILARAKITAPFGYILKPFQERELHATIEMALYKHKIDRQLQAAYNELELRVQERTRELQTEISQRQRAEEALHKHVQELALLNRASQAFNSSLDLDQVLVTILGEIRRLLDVTGASVWLIEPETQEVVCRAASGTGSATVRGWRLALGEGLGGWVAQHGESVIVADTHADERYFRGVELRAGLTLCSNLSVPLLVKTRPIGVLQVVDTAVARFGAADRELLEALAAAAATAIENARLFTAVQTQRARLHALTARLAEVEETERQRLAQELHDQVGQSLTALDITLNLVRAQTPPDAPAVVRTNLDNALELLHQTTACIRGVMADLRPPVLDDYGLVEALRWHAARFAAHTGLEIFVQDRRHIPRLGSAVETALFRIAQEALTNVAKHAHATQVTVSVEATSALIRLRISDDGSGFDPAAVSAPDGQHGWGLLTMTERAATLGGRCHIAAQLGQGTQITVEIPR